MGNIRLGRVRVEGGPYEQMRTTIALVGKSIKDGSRHLPIRNMAASLATQAPSKNYLGQARAIFDFLTKKKWKYVRDPVDRELVTTSPDALYKLVLGGDGIGVGNGYGAGDCDDIAAGTGALLRSIGFPVRLACTAPPGTIAGKMFGHIFVQAQVPNVGWITVDPVVYPKNGFGHVPIHSRIGFFDLDGNFVGKRGNAVGLHGTEDDEMRYNMSPELLGYVTSRLPDMGGLSGIETASSQNLPEDWRNYGIPDFGAYSEYDGVISGDDIPPLAAEVSYNLEGNRLTARSPILELNRKDFQYLKKYRKPYHGMMALGDDLETYAFDGSLGFFKKLFRRVKKRVKKVARRIGRGIKKVIKKIPGGKYLIRLGKKIWKVAHKFVKPLVKFVGKYAAKLAPVAALIPGFGPAVAAGLYTAGKVANLMQKYGIKLKGARGKVRKLAFPSATIAKKFRRKLKKEARKEAKRQRRGKRVQPISASRRRRRTTRRFTPRRTTRRFIPRRRSSILRRSAMMRR